MKKIVIVHGDKGGVGKSTFSGLLADYFLQKFGHCVLVEGDRKIPDVARRFEGVEGVDGKLVDLARPDLSEEALVALFNEIENSGDFVVINLPAGASSTIDAQSAILFPAAEELGFEVSVAWLIGQEEDSIRLLQDSRLCQEAHRAMLLINARHGDPSRSFWWNHPFRKDWRERGGLEAVFPNLTDRVMRKVRETTGRYSDLVAKPDFTVIERQAIKRWTDQVWSGPVQNLVELPDLDLSACMVAGEDFKEEGRDGKG